MARILFVWELGHRLHHLANVEVMARTLAQDGHTLGVALRELDEAPRLLADVKLQYFQAPFAQAPPPRDLLRYGSYAHVLYAAGFADPRVLQVLVSAWLGVIASFRPDLVVFDHSPAALLASHAFEHRRVIVGSGFCVPPVATPLGLLPQVSPEPALLEQIGTDEAMVLDTVNQTARTFGMPPLACLADLYAQADQHFLFDFPELDPFPRDDGAEYLGVWSGPRRSPEASFAEGSERVFVYLSAFPGLRKLLEALRERGSACWVYAGNIPDALRRDFSGGNIHFSDALVDLRALAGGCDLFVSHGSHASVAQTLLAGIPQLVIPYFKEQEYTGQRIEALGAGRLLGWREEGYTKALESVLGEEGYESAAKGFSVRHADFRGDRSEGRVRERVGELLG